MHRAARRLAAHGLLRFARRVLQALCLWLAAAGGAAAQEITSARYAMPTDRYPHAVLGDDKEWARLVVEVSRSGSAGVISGSLTRSYNIDLDPEYVFEDTEPRLWDMTGDGKPEIVVVQSHQELGARLLVVALGDAGKPIFIAATPHIGQRFRWLAPVGAADFDGDGNIEVAYVDRPHLAKTLRIWRLTRESFREVATLRGVTNHRIGERDIAGGLRSCTGVPEMIVASGNWRRLLAVRFDGGQITSLDIGAHEGRDSFARALRCD